MGSNPHSKRKYSDHFGVSKVYPKRNLISVDGELYDAATVSFVLPFSEAKLLAEAVLNASSKNPETVEIKVERRLEKVRKSDGLFPATVTFQKKKTA
jgi:hypothetical protein